MSDSIWYELQEKIEFKQKLIELLSNSYCTKIISVDNMVIKRTVQIFITGVSLLFVVLCVVISLFLIKYNFIIFILTLFLVICVILVILSVSIVLFFDINSTLIIIEKKVIGIINFIKKSKIKEGDFKTCDEQIYRLMGLITSEDVLENPIIAGKVLNRIIEQIYFISKGSHFYSHNTGQTQLIIKQCNEYLRLIYHT
jgi:hypothetical protein